MPGLMAGSLSATAIAIALATSISFLKSSIFYNRSLSRDSIFPISCSTQDRSPISYAGLTSPETHRPKLKP